MANFSPYSQYMVSFDKINKVLVAKMLSAAKIRCLFYNQIAQEGKLMGTCTSIKQRPMEKQIVDAPTDSSSNMGNIRSSRLIKSKKLQSTSKKEQNILLNQLFNQFDKDADQYLNLQEIQAFLKHLYRRTSIIIDEKAIVSFIDKVCGDYSERISREEFILFYKKKQ